MGKLSDRTDPWTRVWNYLRRRGRTREDAEDLVQEAFLRLELYCRQGRKVLQPEAFLMRTAINLSVSQHRHDRLSPARPGAVSTADLIGVAEMPDEVFQAQERLEAIKRTLDAVSRRTRDIFFLHRIGGFSYAEIGKQQGISVSAVEKHIASAVAALASERQRNER